MPFDTQFIGADQLRKFFATGESHFLDFKSKDVSPLKLTRTLSAFANAEGGEVYIGISESTSGGFQLGWVWLD